MKFKRHKYTWCKPFGSDRHNWEFVGPNGGINFHFSTSEGYGDTAGLEFHSTTPTGNTAPDHSPCWLTGQPCWHDGTSLYASETILPRVKAMIPDHAGIFRMLELEYERHFERNTEAA